MSLELEFEFFDKESVDPFEGTMNNSLLISIFLRENNFRWNLNEATAIYNYFQKRLILMVKKGVTIRERQFLNLLAKH